MKKIKRTKDGMKMTVDNFILPRFRFFFISNRVEAHLF